MLSARGGTWRRLRARPATSGDVPPTDLIVSSSRFQICKKNSIFDLQKISEIGQEPDLNKTLKIKFSNSYVLNSNPWLALIPAIGYDSCFLDHHVRTQSIIMEKKLKIAYLIRNP